MKKREGELEDGAQVSALVPGTVGQERQLHLHHIIHRHIIRRLSNGPGKCSDNLWRSLVDVSGWESGSAQQQGSFQGEK
jgi:hypothetical protein